MLASLSGPIFLNERSMQNTPNPLAALIQAVAFAADKHRNQRRKDAEASPYINHPIALANVAGYVLSGMSVTGLPDDAIGYIWVPALVVIALCSVFTAPLGAKAAHSLPVKKLKRIFAMILYALAAYMLYKGLSS